MSITRFLGALALVGSLLVLVVGSVSAATSSVQAGGGSPDQAVQTALFFPGTLTIDVGDTVTWTVGGNAHTVSFGTPPFPPTDINSALHPAGGNTFDGTGFVSSGILFPTAAPVPPAMKSFSITFTKPGTFQYRCLIHPNMAGTVVVQPAGSPIPASQASYKASADPAFVTAIQAGSAAQASQQTTATTNPDGTKTYTVNGGIGDGKTYSILRFGTNTLTIHAGDSVTWVERDPNEVHTVTFLNDGNDVPVTLPNGNINPVAAAPAGGKVYQGTGYFNSGFMLPNSSYTLKFDRPGRYKYHCLIHDDLGMIGEIDVLPAGLPQTGGVPGVLALLLGLGMLGGGLAIGRRGRTSLPSLPSAPFLRRNRPFP